MGTPITDQIENVFQDIGGFTWRQAETWAGFCNAVGMDPIPFLNVMIKSFCNVKSTSKSQNVPSSVNFPELWVVFKGSRTRFKLVEPS